MDVAGTLCPLPSSTLTPTTPIITNNASTRDHHQQGTAAATTSQRRQRHERSARDRTGKGTGHETRRVSSPGTFFLKYSFFFLLIDYLGLDYVYGTRSERGRRCRRRSTCHVTTTTTNASTLDPHYYHNDASTRDHQL